MKGSSFICEKSHVFIKEDNPSDKVVTVEKELDAAEVDNIGNLVDLPMLMFINLECGNVKAVIDGG